jgi:hypothetical protein
MNARTEQEIREQMDEAGVLTCESKTKVPGMSYEEGVEAALRWVLGESDDKPMDD